MRKQNRFGVNELIAKTLVFAWNEDANNDIEEVMVRPGFIENTKASTLSEAFDKAVDHFSIDGMIESSHHIDLLVLHA